MRNTPDGRSEEESEGRGPPLGVPVEWNYRPGYLLIVLSADCRWSNRTNPAKHQLTSAAALDYRIP